MRRLGGITESTVRHLSKLWEMVQVRDAWSAAVHGVSRTWPRLVSRTTRVQWLRLCASISAGMVIPSLGTKVPQAVGPRKFFSRMVGKA